MEYLRTYDKSNPYSIERYAQKLIGKTFADVCNEDDQIGQSIIKEESAIYNAAMENKRQKGGLGTIIEERFFHYPANDDSRPDFPEAGVELRRVVTGEIG